MISRAVVCPGAPLLIPGLADQLSAQVDGLVDAVDRAVGRLHGMDRVLLLSSGPRARDGGRSTRHRSVVHPAGTAVSSALITGTSGPAQFIGRLAGPDRSSPGNQPEPEQRSPTAPADSVPDVGVIVGAALLARAGIDVPTTAIEVVDRTAEVVALLDGARMSADRVGVLVLAEGSASRGPASPGGGSPEAEDLDAALAAALRAGDPAALCQAVALDASTADRLLFTAGPALLALEELTSPAPPVRAELLLDTAPLGVGYLVATWCWDDRN